MCGFWNLKKQWTLFILHLPYGERRRRLGERERKYPKHDNRESAENETIEMRIKIHLTTGIAAKLLLRLLFFTIIIIITMKMHSIERSVSISNLISETVMDVKLENHLFMSNFYQTLRSQAIAKPFESQRDEHLHAIERYIAIKPHFNIINPLVMVLGLEFHMNQLIAITFFRSFNGQLFLLPFFCINCKICIPVLFHYQVPMDHVLEFIYFNRIYTPQTNQFIHLLFLNLINIPLHLSLSLFYLRWRDDVCNSKRRRTCERGGRWTLNINFFISLSTTINLKMSQIS